jgi:uncharacterized protein YndB with AHSA1/START domain
VPKLEPKDLSYLETAAHRLDYSRVMPGPPERVFAVLQDLDSWPKWFVDFKRAEKTTAGPLGLGATRRVWVGPLSLEERFVAWDPGKRFSFTMLDMNLPLLASMLEDWQLTPVEGGTRVDYRVRFDVSALLRPFSKLLLRRFGPMFEKALPNLEGYLARSSG